MMPDRSSIFQNWADNWSVEMKKLVLWNPCSLKLFEEIEPFTCFGGSLIVLMCMDHERFTSRWIPNNLNVVTRSTVINNNNNLDNFYCAMTLIQPIQGCCTVHLVYLTNAGEHQAAADLHTKPTDFGCKTACRLIWSAFTIAIIITQLKADTHFTIPRRVEGWVNLGSQHAALYNII